MPKKKENDLTEYYKRRELMNNFDLLQWNHFNEIGTAIKNVTGEKVNHTSCVVRIPWMEHVVYSIEARSNGLHLYPLSELLRKYNGWCEWSPIKPEHVSNGDALRATRWLMLMLGRPYDFHGCLSHWRSLLGFRPKEADARALYCSESIFLAAKEDIVREGDPRQIRCGAGLDRLKNVKIAPVPGEEVHRVIGMWQGGLTARIT